MRRCRTRSNPLVCGGDMPISNLAADILRNPFEPRRIAMSTLFDQSGLTQIAERLVEAARRHGADAADAVAVRGISQSIDVRDGSVEASQRSESDNVGLRAFIGRRQAVVSTNDLSGNGFVDAIAERVVAMARAAPEDRFAGLAEPQWLARNPPDLDLLDEAMPSVADLEALAATAERAAIAVK